MAEIPERQGSVEESENFEVAPAMVEAGVTAMILAGYGEAGEPREFLRQAVVGIFQCMRSAAQGAICAEARQSDPTEHSSAR